MATGAPSVLITQCLQTDFVKPIGRHEPVPNRLHVGYAEALRLMGERPAEGPVARLVRWAHGTSDDTLRVVHLRDWHDASDPSQASHLEQFGPHCLANTPGAAFAFGDALPEGKQVTVVDTITLNDFVGTQLEAALAEDAARPRRAGVVGVWTEAKVSFLCYELVTRYPGMEVAVCSALCASSSRQHHFEALDQLERILGVRVIHSVGDFIAWLGGEAADAPLLGLRDKYPEIESNGFTLRDTDRELVRYLFRDCKRVELRVLDGGFSGNVVASAAGIDLHGHEQVPHVLKIGEQGLMGQERASFERVQQVLGNNAPAITDFADLGDRGAIKYRYASMGGAFGSTLQKQVQRGAPLAEVLRVLDVVFTEQLGRFYRAARQESGDLLEHYGFVPKWAPSVQGHVAAIVGGAADGPTVEVLPGVTAPNVARFYDQALPRLQKRPRDTFFQSWVHGDLNGQNVILDAQGNVWIIDFFHTRRAHVLLDLLKMENDLLYIWTPLADEDALRTACALTDRLLALDDAAAVLPPAPELPEPFARTWAILGALRAHHGRLVQSDRDPLQTFVGLLRYAVHTLSFEECTPLQKRWALYAAGKLSERVLQGLARSRALRVDWLRGVDDGATRVGLTILPGRRDFDRDLATDLDALVQAGVHRVVCMVPSAELEDYGVPDLLEQYRARGLALLHAPLLDQKAGTVEDMRAVVDFIEEGVRDAHRVLVHCVGGLGRSGMAVACWLTHRGLDPEQAIAAVREARSARAVETAVQEAFVREYAAASR